MSALLALHEAIGYLSPLADPPPAIPSIGTGAPPGGEKFSVVLGWVSWIVTGVCILAIMIAAGTMALAQRRGGGGEHASAIGWIFGACVLLGSASQIVRVLLT